MKKQVMLLLVFATLLVGCSGRRNEETVKEKQDIEVELEDEKNTEEDIVEAEDEEAFTEDSAFQLQQFLQDNIWVAKHDSFKVIVNDQDEYDEFLKDDEDLIISFLDEEKCLLAMGNVPVSHHFDGNLGTYEILDDIILLHIPKSDIGDEIQMSIPEESTYATVASSETIDGETMSCSFSVEGKTLDDVYNWEASIPQNNNAKKYLRCKTNHMEGLVIYGLHCFGTDEEFTASVEEYYENGMKKSVEYYDDQEELKRRVEMVYEYNQDGIPIAMSIDEKVGNQQIELCFSVIKSENGYEIEVLPQYEEYLDGSFQRTVYLDMDDYAEQNLIYQIAEFLRPQNYPNCIIKVGDYYEKRYENNKLVYWKQWDAFAAIENPDLWEHYFTYSEDGKETANQIYRDGEKSSNSNYLWYKGEIIGDYTTSDGFIDINLRDISINLDEKGQYVKRTNIFDGYMTTSLLEIYDEDGFLIYNNSESTYNGNGNFNKNSKTIEYQYELRS